LSLQRRLTVFFIVIVILPLAVAGIVVQRIVGHEVERRTELSLGPALEAVVSSYNVRFDALETRVRAAARSSDFVDNLQGNRREFDRYLGGVRNEVGGVDFLIMTDPSGKVVGADLGPGLFLNGFEPPSAQEMVDGPEEGAFASLAIPIRARGGERLGALAGGFWFDRSLLIGYSPGVVDLSVVVDGRVVATTAPLDEVQPVEIQTEERFDAELGEDVTARAIAFDEGPAVMASTPRSSVGGLSTQVVLLGLLALAFMGTAILAYWLARLITQPLEELAHGAQEISMGHFDHRIPVRARDEVGSVAVAFNEMTEKLRETIGELSSSRDQLQRAIRRVGDTLRSTHDMRQMLDSIVNTAADAVQADAAVLWMFTATREGIYPAITRGVAGGSVESMKVGEGIAGHVAERGREVIVPSQTAGPRRVASEPELPVLVALPLFSQSRLMGVLVNYRKDPDRPFSSGDVDTMFFLAEQGGVAIENVLLHEDAQRLSLTDGLTGVWNRRYFQMQFRQALATASRFERPFSILMLDLDRFKAVNDTHGHQRGDAILVEISQRLSGVLREIDTFARYGGEEFICLLAETALAGAATTAEKIRDSIKSKPFGGVGDEPLTLTVSIGVASYPDHGDSFRALVEAADQALYRAKQEGRDRVRTAGGSSLRVAT
jgi:two-component system cell cycle response regulator